MNAIEGLAMDAKYLIRAPLTLCAVALLGLSSAGTALSQSAAAPAVHDGQHDFDFNIGTWRTHINRLVDPFAKNSPEMELNGTVTVRKVWDGKAQLEEIEADGPKGHWQGLSLFLYNPAGRQWSQTFVNSRIGTLNSGSSNIGEFRDGKGILIGQDTVDGRAILIRAVWSDITADSHKYEESYSDDGGATWVRAFTAHLTRVSR